MSAIGRRDLIRRLKFKQTILVKVRAETEEMVDDLNITAGHDQHLAFSLMQIIIDSKFLSELRRSRTMCCVYHVVT